MSKKYTDQEIQIYLSSKGLTLDKYEGTKSIYAHDNVGYKYHFSLSNLRLGRTPSWLQNNPFALENIKLFLQINAPYYELLDENYVSCKTKMRFICHRHEDKGIQLNSFDNIVHNHHICKFCGYEELARIKQISEEELIKLCQEKNVIYSGRKLSNGQTYVLYICPEHIKDGIQEMSLDHFRSSLVPCHFCTITQGEYKVKTFLDDNNIDYIFQHTFEDCKNIRTLEFDFYLPKRKVAIEYDGKQHFEPMNYAKTEEENQHLFELGVHRDEIKNQYCKDNNIKMIRIPYWNFGHIFEILRKELIDI